MKKETTMATTNTTTTSGIIAKGFRNERKEFWVLNNHGVLIVGPNQSHSSYRFGTEIPDKYKSLVRKLILLKGVTSIESMPIFPNLISITIPADVTLIGSYQFCGCPNLTDVYYTSIQKQWNNIRRSPLENECLKNARIHFTHIADGTCGENLTWRLNNNDGTLTISSTGDITSWDNWDFNTRAPWDFTRCTVKHVVIDNGVTTIGDRAFSDCYRLTDVTIPDSVTTIGEYAIHNCHSLTHLTIPDSVTSINQGALSYCCDLTNVDIGCGVTSIGKYAFSSCNRLTDVYYSGTEEEWSKIFIDEGNTPLTNATIHFTHIADGACGDNLTWRLDNDGTLTISGIGDITSNSWRDFKGFIKGVVIEDGITSICNGAFCNCTKLTSAVIPDSVTSIGNDAFLYSDLTDVTIPNSVTTIGDKAFYNCYNLTSVAIPDSVAIIGKEAFFDCWNLTNITIPDSVTSIGESAFSGCIRLTDITIPDSAMHGGTMKQLCSILFEGGEYGSISSYTIHCGDGDIQIAFKKTFADNANNSQLPF